jgi:hypothetical protein
LFRAYLALRERKSVRPYLEKLKSGASGGGARRSENFDETWTLLQLSESRLSPARAETEIGFRPRVGFAEGLRRTAEWFAAYGLMPPDTVASIAETPERAETSLVAAS